MSVFLELKKYIDLLPIIDTHCHKMPSHKGFPEGIKDLVEHSYLGWCHCEWDGTREGAKQFVESLGHNSYFYWIEKSLQKLLKTEKRLTEETFLWFDEQIRMFTKGITSDDEFLKNECHYEKIILDGYWDPGTNLGNPNLYTPTFRINLFLFGYQTDVVDDNGNNPFQVYGWDKKIDFDTYLKKVEEKIKEKIDQGCVALKSSLPYDRSIGFVERTYDEAKQGYHNLRCTKEDVVAFQDYIYFYICKIAAKYDIPFQNHTGL